MKKLMLFLSIVGISVLMTSCMKEVNRNFSETAAVYIVRDNASGLVYGRTWSGTFITSPTIKAMTPGSYKIIAYAWDESNGMATLGDNVSVYDNVAISGTPYDVEKATLMTTEAPEKESSLLAAEVVFFINDKNYFQDHWILRYAYKAKTGQTPTLNFYLRENENQSSNEIGIDVRLSLSEASGTGEADKADFVALDMAPLRMKYGSSTTSRTLNVKFYFYEGTRDTPTETITHQFVVGGN